MNKIDSNKLLLPSKNSAIQKKLDSSVLVPYKNIKLSSKKVSLKKKGEGDKSSDNELIKTVSSIKESLLKIEKLIENNSKLFKDRSKTYKKDLENEKRKEKENKLETKKSTNEKFSGIKSPNLPRTGILDYIKNFLKWVIIGRAFTLFGKYLPKLLEFVKNLTPLYDFVKSITGALFNGLVTFIGWTDKAQKKLREIVGSLGGEPFQKAFDDFSGALTTFANLALIAGLATMGGSDLGLGDALDDISPDKPGKTPSSRKPKSPRITESGGKPASKPRFRNPLRKRPRITGSRPGLNLKNPFRQKPQLPAGGGTPRLPGGQPKITGGTPRLPAGGASSGAKLAAKTLLKSVRPLLRGMIIGGLIDFGLSVALGEDPGRAAFGAIGATLLGTIGGILGGPFAPFTAIGGGALGDWAGRKLYDAFFTGQKPSSKPQIAGGGMGGRRGGRRMQSGGSVETNTSKTYTPRRRRPSTSNIKKPIIIPAKKVTPGKDVGGEQKIKKLFPNTDPDALTTLDWINATDANGDPYAGSYKDYVEMRRRELGRRPNPFKALTETSNILKKIPVVGNLMGAGVDASLGQAFDVKKMLDQFKSGVGYIVDSISTQQISNLENAIKTFAEGGSIPSSENIAQNYNPVSSAELIEKILGPSIEKRVNEAISNIKKEVEKKTTRRPGQDEDDKNLPPIEPGNLTVSSDSEDFWLLVTAALFENGKPEDGYQGAVDVAQAIYNRVSLPGWPKSIRKVILQPNQFQPVRSYGGYEEWEKINSKESAIEFAKKHKGYSGNIVEQIAAALLDRAKQEKARTFVGPRDNFRAESYEIKTNDLDDSTEATRYGHTFGFEPRGANIGQFKKGKLVPAEVNKQVVTGTVQTPSVTPTKGAIGVILPQGRPEFTSKYGFRNGRMHRGHDYGVDANSPVLSAEDGTVDAIVKSFGGWGDAIYVKDSKGNVTVYGHVNIANGISQGAKIKKGQTIATVKYWPKGAAGATYPDNTHLHLERIEGGNHVDPTSYVNSLQPPQQPKPSQLSPQQRQNVQDALVKKGKIPFTVNGQKYFFEAIPDQPGKVKVFKSKNILGYQEEVDITGGKNKFIADAITKKINTMYPTGSTPVSGTAPSQPSSQAPSPKQTQSSNPNIINASEIALSKYDEILQNLKPGQKIVFDKVGSIQMGKDLLGMNKRKYYNPSGTEISRDDFDKIFQSSEVIKQMRKNNMTLQNMQGGGQYLDMNYKNVNNSNKLNTLNTYDDEDPDVLIQPFIIIQKQSPKYVASNPSSNSSSTTFVRSSEYIP